MRKPSRHEVWRALDAAGAVVAQRTTRPLSVAPAETALYTALIMTAPFGSMGDQALAAGAIHACTLAGRPSPSALVPGDTHPWHKVGITAVSPLDPWWSGWRRSLTALAARQIARTDVIVIGADTIDGRYDHSTLAFRVQLVNSAVRSGRRGALVNFSVSANPTRSSVALLRQLEDRVQLFARDVPSQRRMEAILSRPVGLAPDIGCFLPKDRSARVVEALELVGSPPIVLVPNAHLATDFGIDARALSKFWADLATELSSEGPVIVMPHDVRVRPDDVGFSRSIVEAAGGAAELFVPTSAAEAKALAADARVLVGARMHACVGALSAGTPTLGLDYLEKFEGQFAWYGELGQVLPFERIPDTSEVGERARLVAGLPRKGGHVSVAEIGWLLCDSGRMATTIGFVRPVASSVVGICGASFVETAAGIRLHRTGSSETVRASFRIATSRRSSRRTITESKRA